MIEYGLGPEAVGEGDDGVTLRIYDPRGRLVRTLVDRREAAGAYRVSWDGRDDRGAPVPSGVYQARLEAGGEVRVHKLGVLR